MAQLQVKKESNQQQQRTKLKQFGFLKDKSTTAQLLQVFHNIGEKLDKRV